MNSTFLYSLPDLKRWRETNKRIADWVAARQDLIVKYTLLADIHPMADSRAKPFAEQLKEFKGILIDYISIGNFDIFEKIFRSQTVWGDKLDNYTVELTSELLKFDDILDFYEKYEADIAASNPELKKDLSDLMERLEDRFQKEDELLNLYITAVKLEDKLKLDYEKKLEPGSGSKTKGPSIE